MGVIFTLTTILLELPLCRSNYVGDFSNSEVDLHQILHRIESLETRLSECTWRAEHSEQSQRHQENVIRLQASKIEQLESRANRMEENELKIKKHENKLKEVLEIMDNLVKEVDIIKLQRKTDNTSSSQHQAREKFKENMQSQSLDYTSGVSKTDQINSNEAFSVRMPKMSTLKRTGGVGKLNVAFTVSMAGWNDFTLAVHEPLPFNVVNLNDGNGFDSNLKSFTCPVTGIYFFTASILSRNHKFEGAIAIDGTRKAFITTGDGPSVEQGSNSIVSLCLKGQRVSVIATHGALAIGTAGENFSIFSGFLITDLESVSS